VTKSGFTPWEAMLVFALLLMLALAVVLVVDLGKV
jgi:hypothetical protein